MLNLFKTRTDTKYQAENALNSGPNYLSHADEPMDFYHQYEDDGITPIKSHRNTPNLFDDSDIKDRYWLSVARKNLNMYRFWH